ncbi:MAG: pitrilysin family protein [Candidatus Omnitrophota bacterium]|nr:pitrilysin family protein [Candidatus Omnitrophota bacterium]
MLDNGLVVLVKSTRSPRDLVAIDIKLMAGSSLEDGYFGSGVSHLVEHMVFKGTATRVPGDIEKEIKSYGGFINGSVSQDLADYRVTLPSKYLKPALILLEDMLSSASFDSKEFDKEKEVVLSEMRMKMDDPEAQLMRLLNETAYMRHPYKYPPIGYEYIFRRITRQDAVTYYRKMYVPNNMVLSIAGGLDASRAISTAEEVFADFGEMPRYEVIGAGPVEPQQIAKRTAEKEFETNLAYLAIAFHSSSLFDKDLFALDVLAMILGRGDNSRLNKKLLKSKSLVHSIGCWNYTPRDPGLFVITAILDKEKLDEAERAVIDEIEKLKDGNIDDDELETAKRMVVAEYIFSRQNIESEAASLSADYILTGSYDFSERYVEGIQKVDRDDIKKVASAYLREENSNIARLLPKGYKVPGPPAPRLEGLEYMVKKETLQNGLRVLVRKSDKTPTVSITAVISGGIADERPSDNGISNLTSRLLLKGTATRRESDIAGAIERLGGSISAFSGFNGFGVNIEILKPDIETALLLLKDILAAPAFPEDQLEKERSVVLAMIKEEDSDIFNRGFGQLRKELFSPSPYGFRILGEEESIRGIKRDDLINFYKKCYTPENVVISVSGDIESQRIFERLKSLFSDLKKNSSGASARARAPKIDKIKSSAFFMDKEQSLVIFGFQTVSIESADKYALDVLGSILSGSSGRLFSVMRDKLSLAYALGCVQKLAKDTGFSVLYVACANQKVDEVRKVLREEIVGIRSTLASDEELAMAKMELATNYDIATQTNLFFSQNSATDELYGLGCEDLYKYKKAIDKVTKEDARRVAEKYFDLGAYAEVIITQK